MWRDKTPGDAIQCEVLKARAENIVSFLSIAERRLKCAAE